MSEFKNINFGFASAEKEKAKNPELLINGYVDFEGAYKSAIKGDEFLYLGYKGSGKSAIGKKIELESENSHDLFAKIIFIGDFPFTSFAKMVKGTPEPEARLPTAWAWLLLLYVMQSLDSDNGLSHSNKDVWDRSIAALRTAGMIGDADISSLVKRTTKRGFRVGIPKVLEFEKSSEENSDADLAVYVDSLKEIIKGSSTESRHIIVLDGLDDIVTKREIQFTSIGSLILESGRLNELFAEYGLPVKIVILCRTDLFEKTSNANKNKVRQDYAVELDWYHDPREPKNSHLVEIANARAALSLKKEIDVFHDFFPIEVDRTPSVTYCLEMTRHTPRDFLQILSHTQKFCDGSRLTVEQVKSGLRDYSIKYFLPEIKDELNGYCTQAEIDGFVRAVSRLKKREFAYQEFIAEMKEERVEESEARKVLEALFECSALGTISKRPSGMSYFTFKFRNRNSVFNSNERIILHRGVWKALNLV
ncbi:hypothetical protein L7H23_12105 [Sphingopyxis sp. BSN-002]|uniref:P-loop ATPase, Sll1717 family n=1 Tax=Sphingopyxis sp. BSN-002 TaxID=2911495 RepID=UPI001ED9FC99|nr:hypothetical protein [Sphingopyxis sp. BSN-002]UKK83306.1 hypothetical protein L7H23_12105 [Sphingopyxis sp. BSN-002]